MSDPVIVTATSLWAPHADEWGVWEYVLWRPALADQLRGLVPMLPLRYNDLDGLVVPAAVADFLCPREGDARAVAYARALAAVLADLGPRGYRALYALGGEGAVWRLCADRM